MASTNDCDKETAPTVIAHINELPTEILAHIFSACEYEKDNCSALLDLACVCRHWHDISWSHPRFWTSQSLTAPMKLKNDGPHGALLPKLCDHLERWYARAGGVPRELSLSMEKANSKTVVLYHYLTKGTRWKTLSLSLALRGASNWLWLEGLISTALDASERIDVSRGGSRPCWPDLTKLEIISPATQYTPGHLNLPIEHIAPNVAHLNIRLYEIHGSILSVFASSPNAFANLTTFHIEGRLGVESLAFYVHLLSTVPRLEAFKAIGWSGGGSLTEMYAKFLPLRHEALKELIICWDVDAVTLLKGLCLPRLQTLRFPESVPIHNFWRPQDSKTPIADAVKTLILNSEKAATEIGAEFALKKLGLEATYAVVEDQYETIMAVREMVEELMMDCEMWWPKHTEGLYGRLDERICSGGDDGEPMDFFPNLQTFIATFKGIPTFTVSRAESGGEYTAFKASPLAWWKEVQVKLADGDRERRRRFWQVT